MKMSTSNQLVQSTSTDRSFLVHEDYLHKFKFTEYLYQDDNGKWRVDCIYRVAQKQVRGGTVNEVYLYLLRNNKTRATIHTIAVHLEDTAINMPEHLFKENKLAEFKKRAISHLID